MIPMKISTNLVVSVLLVFCLTAACHRATSSHQEMIAILQKLDKRNNDITNQFRPQGKIAHCDSLLQMPGNSRNAYALLAKAPLLLQAGQEQKSVSIYEDIVKRMDTTEVKGMFPGMAIAYMRLGERTNC